MSLERDLASPHFQDDPYPVYARLQREAPVYRQTLADGERVWAVTRYLDVVAALRDPRFRANMFPEAAVELVRASGDPALIHLFEMTGRMMLTRDAPDHTRLRSLVSRAFTPRMVEQLRPRIREVADELIDEVEGAGRMDVIAQFATPLPVIVIAELLGAPVEDRAHFKRWSDRMAVFLDGSIREAGIHEAARASVELRDYFAGEIAQRKRQPRDDLLTQLVLASDLDDALSEDEVIATAVLLLGAGHETTTNLIGNGVLALLQHPAERVRLRARPELVASAVEEMLRFDSPVQLTSRRPSEPVEIEGFTIPAGDEVNLFLGAANRDPVQFPDAQRFDIARGENRHVSFGHGSHFCLGAALARAEAQIAIEALVQRLPGLAPACEAPPRRPGVVLRGLEALPVVFDRARVQPASSSSARETMRPTMP